MIQIDNLNYTYSIDTAYILNNINLNIEKNSYVSILGDNGSAKTTLIKLILKLLTPSTGTILINTDKIGYVPQHVGEVNSQFPITVYELLRCHYKVLNLKNSKLLNEVLKDFGIFEFRNSLISNLSGGQMQKVFIARALLGSPDLLILDEPSTGLDAQSKQEIYCILKNLNLNSKVTILSVEHNIEAALENSTHICILKEGTAKINSISNYLGGVSC